MTSTVKRIVKNNQMLTDVQNQMQDFIEKRTREIFRKIQEGKGATEGMASVRLRDEIETQLSFDFLRAFSGYCLKTDIVRIIANSENAKGFDVVADVERNGEVFRLNTTLILAGGHNIQRLHYRYIVKTDIPKTENLFIALEKKESKFQRLLSDFKLYSGHAIKYESELFEKEAEGDKDGIRRLKSYLKAVQKSIEKIKVQINELN